MVTHTHAYRERCSDLVDGALKEKEEEGEEEEIRVGEEGNSGWAWKENGVGEHNPVSLQTCIKFSG